MAIGRQKVLIAGGGIGGLACALALLQRGDDVTVFEQAAELREIGAGLTISPNAARALATLGLAQELATIGSITLESVNLYWETGEELARQKMGDDVYVGRFRRAPITTSIAPTCMRRWRLPWSGCRRDRSG